MLKTTPRSQKKHKIRKCSFLSILILTLSMVIFTIAVFGIPPVHAAEISLAWDQNSEPDIAGYKIHYGLESGSYTTVTDVGKFTSCSLSDLEEGKTYYFAATAYNEAGYESGYSNEVSHSFTQGNNEPPVASAGSDQTVAEGVTVTLNGSGSTDPDDGIKSYSWTQTGGPTVTLSSTWTVSPQFTAPDVTQSGASLYFRLTVTDNGGLQSTDTCAVNVTSDNETPVNEPPVANAGSDQTVDEGVTVTLNGSGSTDPDDGIKSYSWTQTGGPTVTLSSTWAVTPTFTAPDVTQGGASLYFRLTVTDNGGLQSTDTCAVNVTSDNEPPVNEPPVADAGSDQTAAEGVTVKLDGSNSSDVDDGIKSYSWTQTGGPSVTLSSTSAVTPTFTSPDVTQGGASLAFLLKVTDNGGLQSTDTCIVNVTWGNEPPVASAGSDQTVNEKATVTLDGSGSTDPDDGIKSYSWTQTGGPSVTLSSRTAVSPKFTSPDVTQGGASLAFLLRVTDNGGLQSTDTCIVNVTWGNEPPVANAGSDQTVAEGVTVTLNGSGSTDPDDGIASYSWTQTGGPAVTLSDPTYVQPTFVTVPVDLAGATLTFELTVRDNSSLETTDTVSVTIDDNGITDFPETVLTTTSPQGQPIGLEEESGGNYVSVNTIDSSTIPEEPNTPTDLIYDLIDMTVKVHTPGSMAKVALHFPSPAPNGYKMYHYNRVLRRWTDYSNYAVFNPTRTKVTITMIDGGAGDDDGVSNGIIIDPFALGAASLYSMPSDSTGGSSSDGGSSSCFITTAAYGTSMKPNPMVLEDFRDNYLLLFLIAGLSILVLMNSKNIRRRKRVY
jgi:hypothetical protein